jgi:hypothetical protein
MVTTENQRREARVDVRVPVVIFRGKSRVAVETSDVSFKGLFVCTSEPPSLRSLVRLQVALEARSFEAHAMVVHVIAADPSDPARVPGVGLQFWGLSGLDRTAWDDFVSNLVHTRRATAKASATAAMAKIPTPRSFEPHHPALSEPATPSGVHIVVTPTRTSTK